MTGEPSHRKESASGRIATGVRRLGRARIAAVAGMVSLTLALTACGTSTSTDNTAPSTGSSATGAGNADTSGSTATSAKVSANTASQDEIAAALASAGVSNADRWAREVVEYRPYDTSDSNLTKLRQNLAKYNPGEDTVNKIVSALTP